VRYVEPRIWECFCTIAAERGVTIGHLLSHVDRAMRLEPTWARQVQHAQPQQSAFSSSKQCELKPAAANPNPRVKWAT
jgi:hypothetical protein